MLEVNASIITIGDELLIGQTIDTNSAFIGRELNKLGIWVKKRIAIGDVKEEILETIKAASTNSNLIIITGGLGPTADDITKPALAEYFGSKLVVNEEALENVKEIFTRLNRPFLERNMKQAEVPDNCIVLQNKRGTAPGMWFEKDQVIYISLPGVPNEMQGLIVNSVIPRLKAMGRLPVVLHKTLLLAGKGESEVAEHIAGFEKDLPAYIKLAYLPSYGTLRLRLTGRYEERIFLENIMEEQFSQLKMLVNEWMVADMDTTLESIVREQLKLNKKTMSTAESCTGGYIASLITGQAGASAVYNGSVVSYSNTAKTEILNVPESIIQEKGAVSEEVVLQMARTVRIKFHTDYSLAVSGIMGPDGGTPEKPVGTVWIAVADAQQAKAKKFNFRFNRERNIEQTAQMALMMLLKMMVPKEGMND